MLVEKHSAVLQHVSCEGEPWFEAHGLDRNHFDMHNFGRNDALFDNTVKLVLDKITRSSRSPALDDLLYNFTLDEKGMEPSTNSLLQKLKFSTACLESLSFSEMNEREHDMGNAIADTCIWLSQDPVYQQWFNQQHGLLWIKGHPGVGKSTVMKHIIRHEQKDTSIIIVSFFFHARGVSIQHSISGLFRSLLHQIMKQIPDLCSKITSIFSKKCQTQGTRWEWNQNELQEIFLFHVVEAVKTYRIRIYIDALDECGEEAAVNLVETFRGVSDSLSICFSCRYYPLVASEDGLEISVENNNSRDIETYLRHQLAESQFREQIEKKASGNFQWVKLVTEQVRQLLRKGKPTKAIQDKIASLPIKLSELYEELLTNIDESDKPQSLKLLQWILFACIPLKLRQLRFAMTVDEDITCRSIHECQESELYVDTDEAMEKRVIDLSHGLAETVGIKVKRRVVQFIHLSVNDFLLESGLQILHQSLGRALNGSLSGSSHFRLSRSCLKYLSMSEIENLSHHVDANQSRAATGKKIDELFPFFSYAMENWIDHAVIVEEENIPQPDLISYFYSNFQSPSSFLSSLIAASIIYDEEPQISSLGPTLMHIACKGGLLSVLEGLLDQYVGINQVDDYGRTPLWWAACMGHEEIVKLLLKRDDVIADLSDLYGNTPLAAAASLGLVVMVSLLSEQEDVAADSRYYHGIPMFNSLWLEDTSMVHLYNEQDDTPAFMGHKAVVKLLLERDDVMPNSRNKKNNTPLYMAALEGHAMVVRLLLERDEVKTDREDILVSLSVAERWKRSNVVKVLKQHLFPTIEDNKIGR